MTTPDSKTFVDKSVSCSFLVILSNNALPRPNPDFSLALKTFLYKSLLHCGLERKMALFEKYSLFF
jgi:hypothetical protein